MNRLVMSAEIERLIPMLALRYKDDLTRAEKLRREFVKDYPAGRISELTLDEFVIGKGTANRSFCYRLERELDELGRILGSTAFKFGIYFGRTKSDPTDCYRFRSHWGKNKDEVFVAVKEAIMDLLKAADIEDAVGIAANPLSPMFKGKILFIYYPDQFAPIYSEEHLTHFITELDIVGTFACGADMQRALMDYRSTWPELVAQPYTLYMWFLYDLFGYPAKKSTPHTTALPTAPLISEAISGAQFIPTMPPLPLVTPSGNKMRRSSSNESQDRQRKRIGDRGEAIVLALEKERLIRIGKMELAAQIEHVSEINDSAGYDILSFEEDGSDRPIEVKATTAPDLRQGFYITANELRQLSTKANYHLYIVFSAMTKNPKVYPMKQPNLQGSDFNLSAINFHVTSTTPGMQIME